VSDDTIDGTELDFWLGDWAVTWDGGHGTNRIRRVLRGWVIEEEFAEADVCVGAESLHGRSWSVFDPTRQAWRQTRVDNRGSYLELVGRRVDGWFAFERAAPERGPEARQRMVFRDLAADSFQWTWEASADGGATWAVRWAIEYRRQRSSLPIGTEDAA
jgi:hypothetical protein